MDRLRIGAKLAVIASFCLQSSIAAEPVNIIAWWDYIDPGVIEQAENQCGVEISIDEYYSDPEFLRRTESTDYDIAIYSDTVYSRFIESNVTSEKDLQSQFVPEYLEPVRENFELGNYQKSSVYYQLALTGLLYNPEVAPLSATDSIEEIFAKAKGKTVVMLDEHVEVLYLLSKRQSSDLDGVSTIGGIVDLFTDVNINVTNALANLTTKDDFAFAFTWSGEALERIHNTSPNLAFLVHPTLSHISKDMLTLMTEKDSAECVARKLSEPYHLNLITKSSFYFSPFENKSDNTDVYNELNENFQSSLNSIESLTRITPEQYEQLDLEWQKNENEYRHCPLRKFSLLSILNRGLLARDGSTVTIQSVVTDLNKLIVGTMIMVFTLLFCGNWIIQRMYSDYVVNLDRLELDSTLQVYSSNLINQISVIASATVFLDFIRSGGQTRNVLERDFYELMSKMPIKQLNGWSIYNQQAEEIFKFGQPSENRIRLPLCYIGDKFNAEFGKCEGEMHVYIEEQTAIEELQKISSRIQSCVKCDPITEFPVVQKRTLRFKINVER